uniref:Uncharacterized protein n=1 Tax=Knipowitschia caucasica TaxID=637954 RepID=A0AAV2MH68_KNICA
MISQSCRALAVLFCASACPAGTLASVTQALSAAVGKPGPGHRAVSESHQLLELTLTTKSPVDSHVGPVTALTLCAEFIYSQAST